MTTIVVLLPWLGQADAKIDIFELIGANRLGQKGFDSGGIGQFEAIVDPAIEEFGLVIAVFLVNTCFWSDVDAEMLGVNENQRMTLARGITLR
jgi:hypothetical protein